MRVNTSGVKCEQLFLKVAIVIANGFTPSKRPRPHAGLHCVGVTHGNVGRAVCVQATVQRPNVINVNGDRPKMSNIRQPQRHTGIAGGEHYTTPDHNTREQDPWKGRARRIGTPHA